MIYDKTVFILHAIFTQNAFICKAESIKSSILNAYTKQGAGLYRAGIMSIRNGHGLYETEQCVAVALEALAAYLFLSDERNIRVVAELLA